jgi:hypothetical protein
MQKTFDLGDTPGRPRRIEPSHGQIDRNPALFFVPLVDPGASILAVG